MVIFKWSVLLMVASIGAITIVASEGSEKNNDPTQLIKTPEDKITSTQSVFVRAFASKVQILMGNENSQAKLSKEERERILLWLESDLQFIEAPRKKFAAEITSKIKELMVPNSIPDVKKFDKLINEINVLHRKIVGTDKTKVSGLEHPHRVLVPEDLPFCKLINLKQKDGSSTPTRVFPCLEYQEGHFQGWQSCLLSARLIEPHTPIENWRKKFSSFSAPIPSSNRPPLVSGIQAGFSKCQTEILNLVEQGKSLDQIQRLCEKSYVPDPDIPPQAPVKRPNEEPSNL